MQRLFRLLFLPFQAEGHRFAKIIFVFGVVAHRLAIRVAKLGNGPAIDVLELDDDVKRIDHRVVREEGADAEGDADAVFEEIEEGLRLVIIEGVRE